MTGPESPVRAGEVGFGATEIFIVKFSLLKGCNEVVERLIEGGGPLPVSGALDGRVGGENIQGLLVF
jgi:hypothetical protein